METTGMDTEGTGTQDRDARDFDSRDRNPQDRDIRAHDTRDRDSGDSGARDSSAPGSSLWDGGRDAGDLRALRRPVSGRLATGVAAGLADYLRLDVSLIRIGFAVLALAGGAGIWLYLAGLLLIPEEGSDQSLASSILQSIQNR